MNDEVQLETAAVDEPVINEQQAQMVVEALRSEQNLMMGALSGFIASMLGAGVWAGVTIATEYQIGWMAIGIGFLVGFAVRLAGKGLDQSFGIVGAVLALLGCAVGNVVTFSYFIANSEGLALMDVLSQMSLTGAVELLTATFEIMDVLFYGLAAYVGYKYAFRQVTQDDFDRAAGKGF